jgi:hypothetical protein
MEIGDCKLCLLKDVDLRASHFLPRSFYALMRTDDHIPVYISKESMYSSTKQVKDYVFCGDCEQCFGKAETWIKPMLPEVGGPFPLRERLRKQVPIDKTADWELYEAASNPEINVDKLTHFGIGVFYKGAVHPWNGGGSETPLKLAPEELEALRQYLLGLAELPKNMALTVTVDSLPVVWQAMIQPYQAEPLGGFNRYVFYIPGVFFQLLIGDGVQDVVPNFSADPRHLILVEDVSHPMRNTAREQTADAKRTEKLEKTTAEIDAEGLSISLGEYPLIAAQNAAAEVARNDLKKGRG